MSFFVNQVIVEFQDAANSHCINQSLTNLFQFTVIFFGLRWTAIVTLEVSTSCWRHVLKLHIISKLTIPTTGTHLKALRPEESQLKRRRPFSTSQLFPCRITADLLYLDLAVRDSKYRYLVSPKFIAMAPKRAARAAATPSPAPRPSPGPNATPGRLIQGRIADSGKAAAGRTAMPTKYSTSYGSPMSQLPNKAVIHGGASLAEAASDVFKTVREDQRAAVEARRKAEERRQTVSDGRRSATPAPAPTKPSITAATEEESEDEIQRSVEVSLEWEEQGESVEPEPVKRPPGRPKKTETANKLGKRQREEAEAAERQAEQERVEREARLQRERSEEARRMAEEQRARLRAAEEEEARRKAEEQRARQRAAEEAERAERVRQEEEQRAQRARKEAAEQRARLRAAQEAERAERARQEEEEEAARARQEAEELARREKAARLAEQRRAREARKAEQERLAQEEAARRAEQERRAEEEAAREQAEQERRARRASEADRLAQEEAARRNSQANRRALEEAVKNSLEQQRRQALKVAEAAAKAKAEEAARARALEAAKRHQSMPPPSAPQVPPGGRGASLPPVTTPVVAKPPRVPESVRSFVEESDLFVDAQIATPRPRPPTPGKKPVHRVVPKPVIRPQPESRSSSDPLTSEEIEPPAPVRKPPPRPPSQPEKAPEKSPPRHDDNTDELAQEEDEVQEHNRPKNKTPKPHVHVAERLKSSLNPWSLWKLFLTSLLILYAYRFIYSMARPDLFESPITSLRWYGWNKWKANAGQFFPSPLLHPLGVLTDKQYDDLKEYIHNESSSTEEAVKSLQSILPRIVHVRKDRRTNKLIIDDEFWRALKDQVHSDDSILTLDGKSDISDRQWRAIQKRLKNSGDIKDTAERTLTKSWEKWLRSNERKVADIIGKHLPQGKPGKHGGGDIQDIAITKEEFTRRLQPILDENKLTSAKIKELEKLVNKSLEKSRSTGDMSTINESRVKEIVNKAIKSAKLEAAASSEISRFDAELQKQLNHFGIGNGAMVDETFSSPTWEVVKPPLGSREWLKTLPSTPRFLVERSAALSAWDEAGHCWCAGTQINATHSRPADLFVHLSNVVIPQHIVLEHINPAATLDPGAMPKDIEIWAQFDEYHRKEKIRDFMEVTFPDAYRAKRNRDLVGRGFLQIGRFRYEHRASDRGVKVERLSRELVGLKAATDHVLVRAASNHGAKDHTCFYRIRLYGEVVALEAGERESRGW